MIADYISFSLNTFKVRKLRTSLTMLGIFIGIAAVVALISLGQGMEAAINDQFQKVGIHRVIVTPGGAAFGPASAGLSVTTLTEDDLEAIEDTRGVENAFGIFGEVAEVEFNDETSFLNVWGGSTEPEEIEFVKEVGFFEIESGRELRLGDSNDAVLGYNIANEEFDKKIRVGDKIRISGEKFDIVGIQKKAGTGVHDVILRIPLETSRRLFNDSDEFTTIFVKTSESEETSVVAERIKENLRKQRDVDEGEEDFSAETSEQAIEQLTSILGIVQIFLVSIAAISLVVGGVGIMNTMYTSVLERTREIGIMKAIGATNGDVLGIFLIEAGILGLAGGIVGVIMGLIMSKTAEIIAINMGAPEIFRASFSAPLILGSLLFALLVGVISGVLPAMQASKLNPVEAIRKR